MQTPLLPGTPWVYQKQRRSTSMLESHALHEPLSLGVPSLLWGFNSGVNTLTMVLYHLTLKLRSPLSRSVSHFCNIFIILATCVHCHFNPLNMTSYYYVIPYSLLPYCFYFQSSAKAVCCEYLCNDVVWSRQYLLS